MSLRCTQNYKYFFSSLNYSPQVCKNCSFSESSTSQKTKKCLLLWLKFFNKKAVLKYKIVGVTLTVCAVLLPLVQYNKILRKLDLGVNIDTGRQEFQEKKDYFLRLDRTVKNVNCHAIIHGDGNETKRAENVSESNPKVGVSAKQYTQMTSNCSNFISNRGYITDSLTDVEKNFPIAFSLLMFKDIEQSERLLRAIYRPQNIYCVHVDNKSSNDIYNAMTNIANCFDNVFIAKKRYNVKWGTMTVLEPDLLCMEELWNKSKSWKYFINLTGQEFPLRTNYELVHILNAYNGANDIDGTVRRVNKNRWSRVGKPPHGIVPTKGSVHIVASRGYVDFVLHDERARDFLNWTRHTKVPDETFFASLNHNPTLGVPGSYKGNLEDEEGYKIIKPSVSRFKNWGNWPCKGRRVRMVCVFGTGDLPMLSSRREMFANKFYLNYHHFALDCMEELHFNHTRDEYIERLPYDPGWYSELRFVSNKVK